MHKPGAEYPVYCHDCWWSDKWDPLQHGREYDFKKPFFEQFAELQKVVPRPAMYSTDNENSDYCNHTAHMKNSYLMFGSWFAENCGYGQTVLESKDCWDCLFIKNCEFCFSSVDCTQCYQTHFSQKCSGCTDSAFLYDCRNCQNCLFSFNLRNKSYYVYNKQVSKEEFEKVKRETFSSAVALQKAAADFWKMVQEQALHKFLTGEKNDDVSGEFIYNSKNVHQSYYIHDGENEKYAVRGGKGQKDAMDVFGVHAGELAYECNNIDFSSRAFFSINGEKNANVDYLVDSFNATDCFGSISLRKQEFCILNKKYDEKSYRELREKIIAHMSDQPYVDRKGRRYIYGELFPIEIAPFDYNESIAQEYVPITKKQAKEFGYAWHDIESKDVKPTKSWQELSDDLESFDDAIHLDVILCQAWDEDEKRAQEHKCTKGFKIIKSELAMYKKWNVPLPRKCPNTRNFELSQLRNPVSFWHYACECNGKKSKNGAHVNESTHAHNGDKPCSNEFETSYDPDRGEIVYCAECYQAEIV